MTASSSLCICRRREQQPCMPTGSRASYNPPSRPMLCPTRSARCWTGEASQPSPLAALRCAAMRCGGRKAAGSLTSMGCNVCSGECAFHRGLRRGSVACRGAAGKNYHLSTREKRTSLVNKAHCMSREQHRGEAAAAEAATPRPPLFRFCELFAGIGGNKNFNEKKIVCIALALLML